MNAIICLTLSLSIVCTVCILIVAVRLGKIKSSSTDVTKDFDRLESRLSEANKGTRQELANNVSRLRLELSNSLASFRQETNEIAKGQRDELAKSLKSFQDAFNYNVEQMNKAQKDGFAEMERRQGELVTSTEKKLEEMRATVDEKLQKTLNERIGQSFKMVSEQLEHVQEGLGEMKTLAADVGGLKNALTNVKVRGNFGELQLKALLEQILSPEQYDENVPTIPGSAERVEFAIKLPGNDYSGSTIYLPIDSKFPKDVYDQYVGAVDAGDATVIKTKSKQFVDTITKMAKDISGKYVAPPHTTDFGIMFVPVENIYAEVIRNTQLTQDLRDRWHVLVTGPTTLGALLSSLQMGFRTLAIQKHSSEIWQTLIEVKAEFSKFGGLLDKAQRGIASASTAIDELKGTRTNAINRKLCDVEMLSTDEVVLSD